MRQTFDETTDPSFGARHLPLLRARMAEQGLGGFRLPHEDEHQNESLPGATERLAWATGFTGSAGAAGVMVGATAAGAAEVMVGRMEPAETVPDRYWIPRFNRVSKLNWHHQNFCGKAAYRRAKRQGMIRPMEL